MLWKKKQKEKRFPGVPSRCSLLPGHRPQTTVTISRFRPIWCPYSSLKETELPAAIIRRDCHVARWGRCSGGSLAKKRSEMFIISASFGQIFFRMKLTVTKLEQREGAYFWYRPWMNHGNVSFYFRLGYGGGEMSMFLWWEHFHVAFDCLPRENVKVVVGFGCKLDINLAFDKRYTSILHDEVLPHLIECCKRQQIHLFHKN